MGPCWQANGSKAGSRQLNQATVTAAAVVVVAVAEYLYGTIKTKSHYARQ